MPRRQFDRTTLEMALAGYAAQHAQLTAKMAELRRALGKAAAANDGGGSASLGKRRPMSAAARKRIAAAQRKRWAAFHKAKAAK